MAGFRSLYAIQIKANALTGNLLTDFANLSPKMSLAIMVYCLFSLLPCISNLIAQMCLLLQWNIIEDLYLILSLCNMNVLVSFNTIYFIVYNNSLNSALSKLDEVTDTFMNDLTADGKRFKDNVSKLAKKMNTLLITLMTIDLILPTLDAVFKLFNKYGYINLFKSSALYQAPYNHDNKYYLLTLSWQVVTLSYTLTKQLGCDFFFITVFLHVCLCFKHLRLSFDRVFKLEGFLDLKNGKSEELEHSQWRDDFVRFSLKSWIRHHQDVLRVTKELIRLYSPLLLMEFGVLYCLFTFLIFSFTKQDTLVLVEIMIIGTYWLLCIAVFFVLCIVGTEITTQCRLLYGISLSCRWFTCSADIKSCLLVTGEITKVPIRISTFNSKSYCLSRHTFLWVLRSVISLYLALLEFNSNRDATDVKPANMF